MREPSSVDTTSWAWISQNGEAEDVVRYLEEYNLERLELSMIAWLMRDRAFCLRVIPLLAARHAYEETLWSYAVCHDEVDGMREYLLHQESFLEETGKWLDSPLVSIDPVGPPLSVGVSWDPSAAVEEPPIWYDDLEAQDYPEEGWKSLEDELGPGNIPSSIDWYVVRPRTESCGD